METRENWMKRAEDAAAEYNAKRPWWKKLLGKDEFTAMDVLHNTAAHEFRSKLDDLYDGVMSISSWQHMTKESFQNLILKAAHEYIREDSPNTTQEIVDYYKSKALRFAQWLEDTKYRPFFTGSEREIESVICHIRSIAN